MPDDRFLKPAPDEERYPETRMREDRRRVDLQQATLEDLLDAIYELTEAINELRDNLAREQYSREFVRSTSDPVKARPTSPFGQKPADPDTGQA